MSELTVKSWFERDRAMVALVVNDDWSQEIFCFWDQDVYDLIECGFLDNHNLLESCIDYAIHLGLLTAID